MGRQLHGLASLSSSARYDLLRSKSIYLRTLKSLGRLGPGAWTTREIAVASERPGIYQTEVSKSLPQLERWGLVQRQKLAGGRRNRNSITPLGDTVLTDIERRRRMRAAPWGRRRS